MKRSVLIFCAVLLAFSLTAFRFINWNNTEPDEKEASSNEITEFEEEFASIFNPVVTDFRYNVDSRFMIEITKEELQNARSIEDFLPKDITYPVDSYKSVQVIILDDSKQTGESATGDTDVLTAAQIELLRSVDYSSNILIRGDYVIEDEVTDGIRGLRFTPHITVVPEKQANYVSGKRMLIDYFRENGREATSFAQEDKLQPGKLYFTITKTATISNVELAATSGYESIDNRMIELILKMPGKWEPAENAKGEKVDQRLVLSYGRSGC